MKGSAIDGMTDCAAATVPPSSPAPLAPRCAAAGLDSGTAAELSASMPFDGAMGSLEAGYTTQEVRRGSLLSLEYFIIGSQNVSDEARD
jgi:hypothetical protein